MDALTVVRSGDGVLYSKEKEPALNTLDVDRRKPDPKKESSKPGQTNLWWKKNQKGYRWERRVRGYFRVT